VDLMKDSSGKTFVIEVNSNYGYHIETITGDDISKPLIVYCEKNYKSGNQPNNKSTSAMLGFSPIEGLVKTETFNMAINRIQNDYLKK